MVRNQYIKKEVIIIILIGNNNNNTNNNNNNNNSYNNNGNKLTIITYNHNIFSIYALIKLKFFGGPIQSNVEL